MHFKIGVVFLSMINSKWYNYIQRLCLADYFICHLLKIKTNISVINETTHEVIYLSLNRSLAGLAGDSRK